MATSAALYTPKVLRLATGLAAFPLGEHQLRRGHARSPTCGSTIEVGLALDHDGKIEQVGLRSHACAIGQAAAAIFAASATGRGREDIAGALADIEGWLRGTNEVPDWPGLDAIAAARDFPARHGAMLLPWRAALDALSTD